MQERSKHAEWKPVGPVLPKKERIHQSTAAPASQAAIRNIGQRAVRFFYCTYNDACPIKVASREWRAAADERSAARNKSKLSGFHLLGRAQQCRRPKERGAAAVKTRLNSASRVFLHEPPERITNTYHVRWYAT